ncbi:MAG: DMT family transporter [Candidatus Heimdallarchaeota archaeon]|nr:DMT family transporter [Candidatus Heimdallarchaeota archaeon]MCK4770031.1 DMT family transporter [Candidatus Heimdallarchaeota archaeon]
MKKSDILGYSAAILGGFSFGLIPVISGVLRNLDASSVEQSVLRLFFGAMIALGIILFFFFKKKEEIKTCLSWKPQLSFILLGGILAIMIVLYLASISLYTPAGQAAILIQIHPVFTLILGWIFLSEKITKSKVLSIILAFTGIVVLTQPWNWTSFISSILGDSLAMFLGVLYAVYLLINRWASEYTKNASFLLLIAWVLLWAVIIGLPILLLLSVFPLPTEIIGFSFAGILTPKILGYGFLLAFFGSLIPYSLIMIATRYIESSKASLLLLTEPIGAVALAAIILKETITIWYIVGGLAIIAAACITILTSIKESKINSVEELPNNSK